MEGSKVYVPDTTLVWAPASVLRVEDNGQRLLVRVIDDATKAATERWVDLRDDSMPDSLPLQNADDHGVEDMCALNHLHEPAIVYNLRTRFSQQHPYTYTGSIVVAINPYAWLNLYSKETQRLYAGDRTSLPPHVYATSASAYEAMALFDRPQSILVSGESGAGKTETVKILMEHLASLSTDPNMIIIEKVLKSNPLLEAFGNAKTVRNDNSSRFGKFTQLQFDANQRLVGAKCRHYLLEKSRVIGQAAHERNYHIFYQLRASQDTRWALDGAFAYLTDDDGPLLLDGDSDAARYQKTRDALRTIGVSDEEQTALLDALAGILHMGQVGFAAAVNAEECAPVTTTAAWTHACRLLGFAAGPAQLGASLCNRTVKARHEVYVVPLTVDQAVANRDALAKELYARLFGYLVQRVNDSISSDAQMLGHIDLLDIFGFEAFETNRFEQFCINFANEKLQQKFTHDVFKTVQDEYTREGLGWTYVSYRDNQDMLDMLEAPLGVISLLNEECIRPMGNDLAFCSKVVSTHDANPRLDKQRARLSTAHFALRHYAGTVMYSVGGFVEANKDALSTDVVSLLSTSANAMIAHVFPLKAEAPPKPGVVGGRRNSTASFMGETVVSKFRAQLSGLMTAIGDTQTHYIRCIKPNALKSATAFDLPGVVEQLRCAGVVEAIRISRAAFPNKMAHERFLHRFVNLWRDTSPPKSGATVATACASLAAGLLQTGEGKDSFVMGASTIYFAHGVLERLEHDRTLFVQERATTIQRVFKGYLCRRAYRRFRAAVVRLQANFRRDQRRRRFQLVRRRCILVQALWRGRHAREATSALKLYTSAVVLQRNWRTYRAQRNYLKLRAAVVAIQEQIKRKEAEAKRQLEEEERAKQAVIEQELRVLQSRLDEEKALRLAAAPATEQPALLDDSGRMLSTLQEQVRKWRELHAAAAAEVETLKSENKRIKEAYTAAGASFAALNQHNKQQSKANLRLMSTHAALIKSQEEKMRKYQKELVYLKEELRHAKTRPDDATQDHVLQVLRDAHVAPDVLAKVRACFSVAGAALEPSSYVDRWQTAASPVSCRHDDSAGRASDASSTYSIGEGAAPAATNWAHPKGARPTATSQSMYYEDEKRKSKIGGMFKKMFKKDE
ncbi:myosin-like protein [Achlya hypogyna]|uniref:Myosin-like protein n=1 Tax=Achlya hypogyna TaxID=1202772 RepID=A0A1V9Z290_ACHHY|nr:myosin-like protein [Achlya hypogyna]